MQKKKQSLTWNSDEDVDHKSVAKMASPVKPPKLKHLKLTKKKAKNTQEVKAKP